MRVKQFDKDNWKKLIQLFSYLKLSQTLYLTLEMGDKCLLKWYLDAAFATHNDLRSHTGGTMIMGYGGVINISTKQKLNTKSSI